MPNLSLNCWSGSVGFSDQGWIDTSSINSTCGVFSVFFSGWYSFDKFSLVEFLEFSLNLVLDKLVYFAVLMITLLYRITQTRYVMNLSFQPFLSFIYVCRSSASHPVDPPLTSQQIFAWPIRRSHSICSIQVWQRINSRYFLCISKTTVSESQFSVSYCWAKWWNIPYSSVLVGSCFQEIFRARISV